MKRKAQVEVGIFAESANDLPARHYRAVLREWADGDYYGAILRVSSFGSEKAAQTLVDEWNRPTKGVHQCLM
jgi:hypothetical protein